LANAGYHLLLAGPAAEAVCPSQGDLTLMLVSPPSSGLQGITFYLRGLQLMGQDVQLFVSMITRAVLQGYTLRQREVSRHAH
jgi:hypothetical protein